MTTTDYAIDLNDLRYHYPDGTEALRGISLQIEPKEKVCVAGPNGAGKSTLLHALSGLIRTQGPCLIAGEKPKPDPSLFGFVFQNPDDQLFCPTIGEDIAFGPRNQKQPKNIVATRVEQTLASVALTGFEKRCAHHLSGGEKKRASIAAALACQPQILALDEPWANLDMRACRAVTQIMLDFQGTLLVASHDLHRAANVCSRLVIIDKGDIAADGLMLELLSNKSLLESYGLEG